VALSGRLFAVMAFAALTGCTVAAGPSVSTVATFNPENYAVLTSASSAVGDPLAAAPNAVELAAASSAALQQTIAAADSPAFFPGGLPPAAAATFTSTEYVTDGVVRVAVAQPQTVPLTPEELQRQGLQPQLIALSAPAPVIPSSPEAIAPASPPAMQLAAAPAVAAPQAAPVFEAAPDAPPPAKKRGFLQNLFGSGDTAQAKPTQKTSRPPVGDIMLASLQLTDSGDSERAENSQVAPLPGVRVKNLFGIESGQALDEPFDDEPEIEVASAAGLARLAPNGLLKQTDKVEMSCFKPELVQVLQSIERHYGRKLVVTSGFRSAKGNRRAGGSRNSLHIDCKAADIQVPGVSKWQLAKYLRTMPGRGGVGTYCHTESVHIDIGSRRDWNWRCRRR
jgi:uncharacterized protein YcbK (DUF882 family)